MPAEASHPTKTLKIVGRGEPRQVLTMSEESRWQQKYDGGLRILSFYVIPFGYRSTFTAIITFQKYTSSSVGVVCVGSLTANITVQKSSFCMLTRGLCIHRCAYVPTCTCWYVCTYVINTCRDVVRELNEPAPGSS